MRASIRHGLPFAAIFGLVGVSMAFWPAYLADRGLTPSYIGLLLSAAPWLRLVINGPVGRAADERLGLRRTFALFALTLLVGTSRPDPGPGHRLLVAGALIMAVGFSRPRRRERHGARRGSLRPRAILGFGQCHLLGLGTLLEVAPPPSSLVLAAGSITLASLCIPAGGPPAPRARRG